VFLHEIAQNKFRTTRKQVPALDKKGSASKQDFFVKVRPSASQ
jgi:hypothetical protein